ncbi:MAG: hypothetical protein QOH35_4566 [Acidobacteriaceae bacterium]|nr:hypothetical protein [Acidobacteriaceae bacterium]
MFERVNSWSVDLLPRKRDSQHDAHRNPLG